MALSLAFTLSAFAAEPTPLPQAKDVLAKAIERGKWERKNTNRDDQYGWSQLQKEEKLGKEGQVEETRVVELDAVLIDGKRFLKTIKVNGQAPQGDELKRALEREKKFRERMAKPATKKDADDDDDVEIDEKLIGRYHFTVVGKEDVNGRPAYVLTFLPKQGVKLPEEKRMDKVLNRLEGKVWLDAELYAITKLDMSLTEPTTLMGGLGNVRNLEWKMDFVAVEPGLFMPRTMSLKLDARRLLSSMRVKQHVEYSNYRKLPQLAEAKPAQQK